MTRKPNDAGRRNAWPWRAIHGLGLLLFMGHGLAAAATTAPAPTRKSNPVAVMFIDAPGKDAFVLTCGRCHTPRFVEGRTLTRAEWAGLLAKMRSFGAKFSPQVEREILGYLVIQQRPPSPKQ